MPMLIALAAAVAVPQPGALRTFKDWTVGCDNGRACQAVGLLPEGEFEGATMTVTRGAAANAAPEVMIVSEARPSGIAIDGARSSFTLVARAGGFAVPAAEARAFAAALARANRLALVDAQGTALITLSLAGASAALRYIDDQQKRAGTVTALVAKGPATTVTAPPPLPVVTRPAVTAKPPRTLSPARAGELIGPDNATCDYPIGKIEPEAYRLDARTSLVMIQHPCGNGAYNVFSTALLVDESGAVRRATFDTDRPGSGDGDDMGLVNADFDPKSGQLGSFMKGRGLGDCGTGQSYVWDGMRFRLVEQSEMGECRGSVDYITTWRAMVR